MSFGLPPSAFSESDLHGLVDGQLEPGRKADIVERLKAHDQLRGHVAAWKEQNDLLRASFSEVENEAIPPSLSLTQPPKLKCVTGEDRASSRTAPPTVRPLQPASSRRFQRGLVSLGVAVGCIVATGGWLFTQHANTAVSAPFILATAEGTDGMLVTPSFTTAPIKSGGASDLDRPVRQLTVPPLPTSTIPDLGGAGFHFVGATVAATNPPALVFSYEDAAANRLSLSVSKSAAAEPADAASLTTPGDRSLRWRWRDRVYTLGGTPEVRLLTAIATDLQTRQGGSD